MKIEELSIGDWVEVLIANKARVCKVEGIRWNGKLRKYVVEVCNGAFRLQDCPILPIPLTSEILEKNGFEFQRANLAFEDYGTKIENRKVLLLGFIGGGKYYLMYEDKGKREMHLIDCPLVSVHQLQHALRLAGIEKEIEV